MNRYSTVRYFGRVFLLLSFITFSSSVFAQDWKTKLQQSYALNPDSVISVEKSLLSELITKEDSLHLGMIVVWAKLYSQKYDLRTLIEDTDSLINRKPDCSLIGHLNNLKAGLNFYLNDYEGAINAYRATILSGEQCNDTFMLSKVLGNIGGVFTYLNQQDSAAKYLKKSILIIEQLKDTAALASVLNTLGVCYYNLELHEKALLNYDRALSLNPDPILRGQIFQNYSLLYRNTQELDKALEYGLKSIEIFEKYEMKREIGQLCNIIGQVYRDQKKYDKALEILKRGNAIGKELSHVSIISSTVFNIGYVYYLQGKPRKAIPLIKESIAFNEDLKRDEWIAGTHKILGLCYASIGKPDSANYHIDKDVKYQEEIMKSSFVEDIADLEVSYETAKKEKEIVEKSLEIQTQNATIASQRNRIILLISGVLVLLLGGLLFYNRNKFKQEEKLQKAILDEKEKGFVSVITATENERNRISKDLHDGIGQQLSALKMALKTVSNDIESDTERKKVENIVTAFSKSADEVRQISHQMMPRVLMDEGLLHAVEDLLTSSFQFSAIEYQLEHHGISGRYSEKIEITMYRIIQELINNIIKHSKAKSISVQLIQSKQSLLLFVEDDGVGMDENKNEKGHGLRNIKSRLDMVKGTVNYEPSPTAGTSVTIKIPLV